MNGWEHNTICASPLHYGLVMNRDPAVVGVGDSATCRLGSVVATHLSRIRDCQVRPRLWPFFSPPTIMGDQVEG